MPRHIEVVAAAIIRDDRVLVAQRGPKMALPGLWEFPGGKIEPREAPEAALRREILEELGCSISIGKLITTTHHAYDFGAIVLHIYGASLVDGVPTPSEHSELRWCAPEDLGLLHWAPADIPAVQLVRVALGSA
jgi:8-oxo-dGTP diphosphatase